MHRNRKLSASFLLSNRQDATADMLRPYAGTQDVATALSSVEQERHRQSGP